jgi:ribonuclease BN (tRNA processing enzyme)
VDRSALTILGSASGMPGGGRACSGYLIEHHDALTLLDCGSGVAHSFERLGFDYQALDRVVISHTHPDHVSDLPLLIQHMHLAGKKSPVDLYLPREFETIFGQMIRAMYVIPERYAFELRVHGYGPGVLCERPLAIEAVGNSHLKSYETDVRRYSLPNQMQSCSLRVVVEGTKLLYSGDVASFDEIRSHLEDCNIAILETSHVGIAEIRDFATNHPETRIVLSHLSGENAAGLLATEFGELQNVQVAEDGKRVELTPSLPQKL